MSNNYRFDVRSKKQFAKDIKSSHIKEADIAVRLCLTIHSKTGEWPTLVPNGTDSTGEFIEKNAQVSSEPDFKIGDRIVEITRSDVFCNRTFHQKENKIIKCLKDKHDIVFVNGYLDKQPYYLWLDSDQVEQFTIKATAKYGSVLHPGAGKTGAIAKAAFRYDVFWFQDLWKPLPALISNIPKEYKDILACSKGA